MDYCDMTGCHDTAEYYAEFLAEIETDLPATILEICESCAGYWREHKEEKVKLTKHANKERLTK
jgi:hypothetical protein